MTRREQENIALLIVIFVLCGVISVLVVSFLKLPL